MFLNNSIFSQNFDLSQSLEKFRFLLNFRNRFCEKVSQFSILVWFWKKKSILVKFRKSLTLVKFSKNFDFSQNFEKKKSIPWKILKIFDFSLDSVKFFWKFMFFAWFWKNFDLSRILEKIRFCQNLRKNWIWSKILKDFDFRQDFDFSRNFRQKIRFCKKIFKTLNFKQISEKFRFH